MLILNFPSKKIFFSLHCSLCSVFLKGIVGVFKCLHKHQHTAFCDKLFVFDGLSHVQQREGGVQYFSDTRIIYKMVFSAKIMIYVELQIKPNPFLRMFWGPSTCSGPMCFVPTFLTLQLPCSIMPLKNTGKQKLSYFQTVEARTPLSLNFTIGMNVFSTVSWTTQS